MPAGVSPGVLAALLRLWLSLLPSPLAPPDSVTALIEANSAHSNPAHPPWSLLTPLPPTHLGISLIPLRQQSLRLVLSSIASPARPVLIELLRCLHVVFEAPTATQEIKKMITESWAPLLFRVSDAAAVEVLSYVTSYFPILASLKTDTAIKTEHKDGRLMIVAARHERLIDLALNPYYKGTFISRRSLTC